MDHSIAQSIAYLFTHSPTHRLTHSNANRKSIQFILPDETADVSLDLLDTGIVSRTPDTDDLLSDTRMDRDDS